MKNITIKNSAFIIFNLLFFCIYSHAQELMFKVPLNDQIANSSHIIEGKVISKQAIWDVNYKNIYTVNKVKVFKSFKGEVNNTIDIITEGGVIDMTAQYTTLSLELFVGDIGLFMLNDSYVQLSNEGNLISNKYEAYSALQGFYKYDIYENKVSNPYYTFENITYKFYKRITTLTQSDFISLSPFNIEKRSASNNQRGSITITDFSPVSITGGTRSVLTINGAGFGPNVGSVMFRDANSGGSSFYTALGSQIVSWSDTQIQVEVPSRAGTGTFRVADFSGSFVNSTDPLQIPFSEINVTTSNDISYPTQHIDENGNGGYTWSMYVTFFANTPAKQSFVRALDTWRCETGINWDVSPNFSNVNTIALDDTNVVRFDVGSELPAGVLGRNTSYFNGCSNGTDLDWYVSELDIVFNDDTNWQFGPASPGGSEVDFETVAVHELGHGHQLAHVIDNSAIMHYTVGSGVTNRDLSSNDILGGNDVQNRSTTNPVCGRGLMTNHNCSLGINENNLSSSFSIFPNPAKNQVYIKNSNRFSIDIIELFDMTGRTVKKAKYNNSQGIYTLNTSDLSQGMYLVNLTVEGKIVTKKLVIE